MEKIKPGMFYIAADGDGVGKKVGRAVLANDVDELHKISNRIDAAQDFILHWCKDVSGVKVSGGGDEFTAAVPQDALKKLEALRKSVEKSFGYTISVGVGKSLSEAGTSLLVAKLRGKDRIVYFDNKLKKDIQKAKRRVREKRATPDEYKLSEAYLAKAENMLCDLHKSDTKALSTNAKEGKVVTKRPVDTLTRVTGGKTKPTISHEEMLKVPSYVHGHIASKHRSQAQAFDPQNAGWSNKKGNVEISNRHHKADAMHSAYETHLKHPSDRTDQFFVNDEGHAKAQKEAGEKAKKLHDDLSSIEVGTKMGKSEQYVCELHKSEEGKHAPHTEPNTNDPCPYCADNEDNRTDDCAYCQDLDAEENADGTAGMHDCPACKEYDASQQNTGGIDDCPYCQTENITEAQANPEAPQDHICNCPDCVANQKDQSNLAVEDQGAQHPDDCPQCQEMYSDAVENEPGQTGQGDPNLQGHETAEEVLDLLDQEPGTGAQTPAQAAKKIDNTEMPQGDQMEEGTAVTDNFGDAQKNDISDSDKDFQEQTHDCNCPNCPKSEESGQESGQNGELGQDAQIPGQNGELGQDEPDMSSILQGGLDDHANEQKKQQVLDMVGQTLAGFKANKASLEATKEQNQPLYNSCIQMLKSMIELCKLLGLEPNMAAGQEQPPQAAPQESPAAGPPQAAPQEGSQDPKAVG
jgi:hypothetical protein